MADKYLIDFAPEKCAITIIFKSQPQVLVQTVNGFKAPTITSKVDNNELLKKILVIRTNVKKLHLRLIQEWK